LAQSNKFSTIRRLTMPASPPSQHRRAITALLLANLFWGISFPAIKAIELLQRRLVPDSSGGFLLAGAIAPRFLIGLVVLLAWQVRPGRRPPAHGAGGRTTALEYKQGLIVGLAASGGMLFQNDGLRFTAASTSAFLTQFYAIMIPLWLTFRSRRNPGALVWVSCGLVLAGAALLGHFDWTKFRFGRGETETLLSSVFFMLMIFGLDHPAFAGNRSGHLTRVMFAVQAAVFGTLALATAPHPGALLVLAQSPVWLGLTAILALVCTVGAFSLMNAWQPKISATEAGLIYCVEPIFGSIFALFLPALISGWAGIAYPNETATFNLLVGGGLITLANILVQLKATAALP
jgi:drug/metabolite transporter (DMT)-like permease